MDVTGIISTYAHLVITLYLRSDTAASTTSAQIRFNGDTAANYDLQNLIGNAAVASATETFGATFIQPFSMPAASAGANLFGACQVFIPNYAGTSNNKQVVTISANKVGTVSANLATILSSGSWRSSAAINRITILPGAGNLAIGSRVTIHALGA